jgi:hypothetical protein
LYFLLLQFRSAFRRSCELYLKTAPEGEPSYYRKRLIYKHFRLAYVPHRSECGVRKTRMTNYPWILFNQSPRQLRIIGARGGRTFGRNQRARRARLALMPPPPGHSVARRPGPDRCRSCRYARRAVPLVARGGKALLRKPASARLTPTVPFRRKP